MKKIVFTGGGTAGHVTPNLSIIKQLKNEYEIHYIGSQNGIEKDIIKSYPYVTYHPITTVKLSRDEILKNFLIPFKLFKGINESKKIIKKINPSIIFSKGGFVAVPVCFGGKKNNVPIISHESDLSLGLANKIILRLCIVLCCSFEKTVKYAKNKGIFTGTPIRNELFNGNALSALKKCNFKNTLPTILFMGGSMGAKVINDALIKSSNTLLNKYNIIHITGKGNKTTIKNNNYYQMEYTNNIEDYFALASIVISRAGSNTINELLALKKPMILIPLPKGNSRGDQIENAQEFELKKYCKVIYQENLTPTTLVSEIDKMTKEKDKYIKIMSNSTTLNATSKIIKLIKEHELK